MRLRFKVQGSESRVQGLNFDVLRITYHVLRIFHGVDKLRMLTFICVL